MKFICYIVQVIKKNTMLKYEKTNLLKWRKNR